MSDTTKNTPWWVYAIIAFLAIIGGLFAYFIFSNKTPDILPPDPAPSPPLPPDTNHQIGARCDVSSVESGVIVSDGFGGYKCTSRKNGLPCALNDNAGAGATGVLYDQNGQWQCRTVGSTMTINGKRCVVELGGYCRPITSTNNHVMNNSFNVR